MVPQEDGQMLMCVLNCRVKLTGEGLAKNSPLSETRGPELRFFKDNLVLPIYPVQAQRGSDGKGYTTV